MKDCSSLAAQIRLDALKMTSCGKSSHIGSILSCADIVAVLYAKVLRVDPSDPLDDMRDRFILSKGHAGAAVYSALARTGFFDPSKLSTHYQNGSDLSGHVSHKNNPGVEFSTGSLGHGLPIALGVALGLKRKGLSSRVYVLMSDGELNEGSNWEAIMLAAQFNLENLIVLIDKNGLQSLASTKETVDLDPLDSKFVAFGWEARVVNGHSCASILDAVSTSGMKPKVVICETVKGKGVSFMENSILWHYRSPVGKEYELALAELEASRSAR